MNQPRRGLWTSNANNKKSEKPSGTLRFKFLVLNALCETREEVEFCYHLYINEILLLISFKQLLASSVITIWPQVLVISTFLILKSKESWSHHHTGQHQTENLTPNPASCSSQPCILWLPSVQNSFLVTHTRGDDSPWQPTTGGHSLCYPERLLGQQCWLGIALLLRRAAGATALPISGNLFWSEASGVSSSMSKRHFKQCPCTTFYWEEGRTWGMKSSAVDWVRHLEEAALLWKASVLSSLQGGVKTSLRRYCVVYLNVSVLN